MTPSSSMFSQALSAEHSTSDAPATVVVVGGGFAGLVAARELARKSRARVVLLEAEEQVGGKIGDAEVDGIRVEAGPDSFLSRDPIVASLCTELGLGDELVAPAVFGGVVWNRGKLSSLPSPSVYGMPATRRAALECRALSARGRARAAAEPSIPPRRYSGDVSVASFVRYRFGVEVLERLVDPLLAGTRAGDVADMSMAAALPEVLELAEAHGSVMRGAAATKEAEDGPPFLGLRSGMKSLTSALRADLGRRAEVRFGHRVDSIRKRAGYYELVSESGRITTGDALLITAPAFASERMLRGLSPEVAQMLAHIHYASAASVALAYGSSSVPVPAVASGILVPSSATRTISGCTFFTDKWPHLAPSDGRQIVRCFVGRSGRHPALDVSDDDLASAAHEDVAAMTGAAARPSAWNVTRWDDSLPQYEVGHPAVVSTISALLESHPRIGLAGAAYMGSGLPDVARGALRAAERLLRGLGPLS